MVFLIVCFENVDVENWSILYGTIFHALIHLFTSYVAISLNTDKDENFDEYTHLTPIFLIFTR